MATNCRCCLGFKASYRRRFEAYEAANGGWYELSKGGKLYLLQTWVAELATHPRIVDAAEQPTPLHQPVGDDAELYVALLKEAGTFEQWMDVAMPIVEAQAGPRPEPPARS